MPPRCETANCAKPFSGPPTQTQGFATPGSGCLNFLLTDFSYSNLGGGNTGTFGFNGTSLQFTVVPEPRAALIGGIGMLMLLRRRRSALA
jgi:hypothetical protein